MRGLTLDTINEVVDRKIIWMFAVLVLLAVLVTLGVASSDIRIKMGEQGEGALNPEKIPLGMFYAFMSILVFVSAMVSAASIPSMLGRGRCDFYLSKPISRRSLFLGKLLGLMTVYGALMIVSGIIIYLVIAISLHGFNPGAGYIALSALLQLSVWLTIITWAGLFSGSTTVAIVTAFVVWIVQTILASRQLIEAMLNSPVMSTILNVAYWIVPKTSEMGSDGMALASGETVANWWSLPATLGFAVVTLMISIWMFNKKEL
jgi:ABC-type transport system involved in multi-copper enzyme maturation permease subunit